MFFCFLASKRESIEGYLQNFDNSPQKRFRLTWFCGQAGLLLKEFFILRDGISATSSAFEAPHNSHSAIHALRACDKSEIDAI